MTNPSPPPASRVSGPAGCTATDVVVQHCTSVGRPLVVRRDWTHTSGRVIRHDVVVDGRTVGTRKTTAGADRLCEREIERARTQRRGHYDR